MRVAAFEQDADDAFVQEPGGEGSIHDRRRYVAARRSIAAGPGVPGASTAFVAGTRARCDGAEVRNPLNTPLTQIESDETCVAENPLPIIGI
jgi:hypothetical protein